MSREPSTVHPLVLRARLRARSALALEPLVLGALALVALGCGRDAGTRGRAASDSAVHAPRTDAGAAASGAADAGAAAAPTPGFTSAQGTPAAQPQPARASAMQADRMAPPPPASLAAVTSAEEQAAIRALPPGPGHDLVIGNCLICHAATMITQQHKDSAGWNKTVTQMMAWGAPVPQNQRAMLVAYLAAHYPARATGMPARQVP